MNYRHAYHAGNFADVFKHLILTFAIQRLRQKDKPFRVIDTHAGVGRYDLTADQATRTGEWREGIGRLFAARQKNWPGMSSMLGADPTIAAYLAAIGATGANRYLDGNALNVYPGSPALARALLRPQDMLIVNELHPEDATSLRGLFSRDRQTKVLDLDGWLLPKSALPPPERRGVILVDPPFEEAGEFDRLARVLREGIKRFATGIYLLWYPIKNLPAVERFKLGIAGVPAGKMLAAEIFIRAPDTPDMLNGCGLIIHNPPFGLTDWLEEIAPALVDVLHQDKGAQWRIEALRPLAAG
jgi:23S rRNA (adenine2030-N6)-methyltransferase